MAQATDELARARGADVLSAGCNAARRRATRRASLRRDLDELHEENRKLRERLDALEARNGGQARAIMRRESCSYQDEQANVTEGDDSVMR